MAMPPCIRNRVMTFFKPSISHGWIIIDIQEAQDEGPFGRVEVVGVRPLDVVPAVRAIVDQSFIGVPTFEANSDPPVWSHLVCAEAIPQDLQVALPEDVATFAGNLPHGLAS